MWKQQNVAMDAAAAVVPLLLPSLQLFMTLSLLSTPQSTQALVVSVSAFDSPSASFLPLSPSATRAVVSRNAPLARGRIGALALSSNNPQQREQQQQQQQDASSGASSSASLSSTKFEHFQYTQQWYPVSWVCDLRPNQPVKVQLFDVDYAIAISPAAITAHKASSSNNKDGAFAVTALLDRCPHKAAALSEGRMTSTGYLQCAYHGWSFDGQTGACIQIPQQHTSRSPSFSSSERTNPAPLSSRTCAKAIPAIIHQGMVWLWPGGTRTDLASYPLPPTIQELDHPNFVVTRVVRDFPDVDWTLLVSNILDPDHGRFAHQAPAFDWYAATPETPLQIVQDDVVDVVGGGSGGGGSWTLTTTVPAVDKLGEVDRRKRENGFGFTKKKATTKDQVSPRLATSVFHAPTTISLSRRIPASNIGRPSADRDSTTSFVSGFWVCPTGTGKSRFFAASMVKAPKWIRIPRWLYHINLNNFLDQDTVLVASQQAAVLSAELEGTGRSKGLFAYGSPTERAVRLIDQFWDETVSRVPNRNETLKILKATGQLLHTPDRRIVLDREGQHLNICPDSQDAVRNCRAIRNSAWAVAGSWLVRSVWTRSVARYRIAIVAMLVAAATENVRQRFYFYYPESKRNRDLKQIPRKMWIDPH
jgi:phenylpropionate dioxygenase-like ring-hydroxylating dioxygenase large terminal subunit